MRSIHPPADRARLRAEIDARLDDLRRRVQALEAEADEDDPAALHAQPRDRQLRPEADCPEVRHAAGE